MNRWLRGLPAGRAASMRADSKHSPAAHCDFACGRSGLSCNGGGSGTPQAPRCTERSSSHDARPLGVYLPTYVRGYAEQRDRGGCRVGWVGWLDTGLGSMHTARPTPLLRCHLALSSSFNPLQPYHRLRVPHYLSLSLSLTFFLCLSSPPPVPLSFFSPLAEYVFFYLSLPVAPLLLAARQSVNPAG